MVALNINSNFVQFIVFATGIGPVEFVARIPPPWLLILKVKLGKIDPLVEYKFASQADNLYDLPTIKLLIVLVNAIAPGFAPLTNNIAPPPPEFKVVWSLFSLIQA